MHSRWQRLVNAKRNFANGNTVVVDLVSKPPETKVAGGPKSSEPAMAQALDNKAKETSSTISPLLPSQPAVAQPGATKDPTADAAKAAAARSLTGVATEQVAADAKAERALANADRAADPLSARPAEISLKVAFDEPSAAAVFRVKSGLVDRVQGGLAQRLGRLVHGEHANALVHAHKPLGGSAVDHRCLVAPAVRVAVGDVGGGKQPV